MPHRASTPATLRIQRRNLPHRELGGSTYFLTYRCQPDIVLPESCRDTVLENWRHWEDHRYLLHTLVVMPDHIHAILTPLPTQPAGWFSLESILHTNKSFSAHQINLQVGRQGPVWQDERYDRILRNDNEFWEKWNYIADNLRRRGLVDDPLQYKWLYQNSGAFHRSAAMPPK